MRDISTFIRNKVLLVRRLKACWDNHWSFWLALGVNSVAVENIPRSTKFTHPYGISIHYKSPIGENCWIRQNVTIGRRYADDELPDDYPKIGNNVLLCAGATVLGDVIVGDNAVVGAGAIVLRDVPQNVTVTGVWR